MEDVAAALNAICDAQPFQTSWHLKHLATGAAASRCGDVPVPSASTRKIAFMMATLAAVHAGRLRLDERLVAEARFMQGVASGVLYYMTPGFTLSLRDAIVQMIVCSDNVCTGLIGERMPVAELQAFCDRAGMTGTRINAAVPPRDMPEDTVFDFVAQTTPDDQARLMQLILDGSGDEAVAAALGVTSDLCRMALQIMSWQAFREGIPGLLPTGTVVANKTGGGKNGKMDVGLVYRDGAPLFILAAYTDKVPPALPDGMPGLAIASRTIAHLSRAAWDGIGAS